MFPRRVRVDATVTSEGKSTCKFPAPPESRDSCPIVAILGADTSNDVNPWTYTDNWVIACTSLRVIEVRPFALELIDPMNYEILGSLNNPM